MDILLSFAAFCCGSLFVYFIFHLKFGSIKEVQKKILVETEHQRQKLLSDTSFALKEKKIRQDAETRLEEEQRKFKWQRVEEQLKHQQEEGVVRQKKIEKKEQALKEKEIELRMLEEKLKQESCQLAGMSPAEAKLFLLQSLEKEVREEGILRKKRWEEEFEAGLKERSQKILETAIQRISLPSLNSIVLSGVPIEDEEIKGRIVGKEGRNIRTFEETTGTTLLMDESPHSILISSFDPIRREVAVRALRFLVSDGKIHPSRIEEVVQSAKGKVEEMIVKKGEEGALKAGVPSLHPELIKLLGKLHFRYSLGQNLLEHSIEVSHLLGLIAEEIGASGPIGKRIGLLHDIGKAVDEQKGKSHAIIGMETALRFGENEEIANGIGCHHFEIEPTTLIGALCHIADAISASRPGARQERLEYYVKRMQDLESIANEVEGVEKVYALKMGKEIRVIVHPHWNQDKELNEISKSIKEKIQAKNPIAGKVKLTLCCERKIIEMI